MLCRAEWSWLFPLYGKGNDLLKVATTLGSGIKVRYTEQSGALSSRSVDLCKIRKISLSETKSKEFQCVVPERNNCHLPFVWAVINLELSENGDIKEQGQ